MGRDSRTIVPLAPMAPAFGYSGGDRGGRGRDGTERVGSRNEPSLVPQKGAVPAGRDIPYPHRSTEASPRSCLRRASIQHCRSLLARCSL